MINSKVRVDWFRVLVELERKGYNQVTISAAIDVARTTMIGWRNLGAEPSHQDGERLISLWCQVMQCPRDGLPLNVSDLLSAAAAKR